MHAKGLLVNEILYISLSRQTILMTFILNSIKLSIERENVIELSIDGVDCSRLYYLLLPASIQYIRKAIVDSYSIYIYID